jgi:hypothetical protein
MSAIGKKLSAGIIVLSITAACSLYAQETSFNISSGALQEGSLTDGFIETSISDLLGIRVNFNEKTDYETVRVPGTDLSTQYNESSRQEIDMLFPIADLSLQYLKSAYLGLNVVRITEKSSATFVIVDDLGEFGTDYRTVRKTIFLSPRIGFAFIGSFPERRAEKTPVVFDYKGFLSPVYFFTIDQNMSYQYTDHADAPDPLTLTNSMTKWASPYIKHKLIVKIGNSFRLEAQHSYQFLPYKSMQLTQQGDDVEVIDDPTHINTLTINGDITIPIGDSFSVDMGIGYDLNWLYRTSEVFVEAKSALNGHPYLRIGSSLL